MSNCISGWASHADFDHVKNTLIMNRDVFIWGGFAQGRQLRMILSTAEIEVKGYIDSHRKESEYDGLPMGPFGDAYSPESSFIFVAVNGRREEIVDSLQDKGFDANRDYLYLFEQLPHIVISWCQGEYRDHYGNRIVVDANDCLADIEIIGYDNQVYIGRGIRYGEKCRFVIENGARLALDDNVSLGNNVLLEAREGGVCSIGASCSLNDDARICSYGGVISLGAKCSLGRRALVLSGVASYASIGADCMFASDAAVLASDTHTIFDIATKENLSAREVGVEIGEHVWLGKNAIVLYNSIIENGCIIGANSLVKMQADANCVLAGNPARIVSTNRQWDRRRNIQFDDL